MICGGPFTLRVKKIIGENSMDITFSLTSGCRITDIDEKIPDNVLMQTLKSYKAINFIADVETQLPNLSKARLAIQVSTQASNKLEKFRKSIIGGLGTPGIFVMLNPLWTSFDDNYEKAAQVTSGAGVGERFDKMWFGQPVSFRSYKVLLGELSNIFRN